MGFHSDIRTAQEGSKRKKKAMCFEHPGLFPQLENQSGLCRRELQERRHLSVPEPKKQRKHLSDDTRLATLSSSRPFLTPTSLLCKLTSIQKEFWLEWK